MLGSAQQVSYSADWGKIVLVGALLLLVFGGVAYALFGRNHNSAPATAPQGAITLSVDKVA